MNLSPKHPRSSGARNILRDGGLAPETARSTTASSRRPTSLFQPGIAVTRSLAHVALVVRDYDEAIAWFVGKLGFALVEDSCQPEQDQRWVLVAPPGAPAGSTSILLARADRHRPSRSARRESFAPAPRPAVRDDVRDAALADPGLASLVDRRLQPPALRPPIADRPLASAPRFAIDPIPTLINYVVTTGSLHAGTESPLPGFCRVNSSFTFLSCSKGENWGSSARCNPRCFSALSAGVQHAPLAAPALVQSLPRRSSPRLDAASVIQGRGAGSVTPPFT
ncbi:MAG TPA: VOC family protein [Allosphingosinicella sp.]|nr:VOC family protein [Allosphingosinicella sp.]